jgi:hypothetical protein
MSTQPRQLAGNPDTIFYDLPFHGVKTRGNGNILNWYPATIII